MRLLLLRSSFPLRPEKESVARFLPALKWTRGLPGIETKQAKSMRFAVPFIMILLSHIYTVAKQEQVYSDVASSAGIDMVMRSGIPEKPFLMEGIAVECVCLITTTMAVWTLYFVNGSDSSSYLANRTAYSNRPLPEQWGWNLHRCYQTGRCRGYGRMGDGLFLSRL